MFPNAAFVLRVGRSNGRLLETLLAPAPGEPDPSVLDGVIVEASYAAIDPPILARLQQLRVPYLIDPQSPRFGGPGYLMRPSLLGLPYAPQEPITSVRMNNELRQFVRGALEFQADHGANAYVVPVLSTPKATRTAGTLFRDLHEYTYDVIGSDRIPTKRVVAAVAPSYAVLRSPYLILERLLDRVYAGLAVQPVSWSTRTASVEWLTSYVEFLLRAQEYKLPVVAGRAGSFGLILNALGVTCFDTGLGEGESFDLAGLNREPRPKGDKGGGGQPKTVYLAPLMTTINTKAAAFIVANPALRDRFVCLQGECKWAGIESQVDNPRAHFFHTRPEELAQLRSLPPGQLRVQLAVERVRTAIDLARLTNRQLEGTGLPAVPSQHLDRWLAVLGRVGTRISLAAST